MVVWIFILVAYMSVYLKNGAYFNTDYCSDEAVYRSGKFNRSFQNRKSAILYLESGGILMKY